MATQNVLDLVVTGDSGDAQDATSTLAETLAELTEAITALNKDLTQTDEKADKAGDELDDMGREAQGAERRAKGLATGLASLGAAAAALTGFVAGLATALGIRLLQAVEAVVTAIPRLLMSTREMGDQMGKDAARVGMAVEELTRLRFAADLSGASYEQFLTALRQGAVNLEAASRGTGEAILMLDQLGISAVDADGRLRGVGDVILDMADRFAVMEDGTIKSAAAMRILGEGGLALIPLLNAGREGIQGMSEEADRLGVTLTALDVAQAAALTDEITRIKAAFSGLGVILLREIGPSLINISINLQQIIQELGAVLVRLVRIGRGLFIVIGEGILGLVSRLREAAGGDLRQALEAFSQFSPVLAGLAAGMEKVEGTGFLEWVRELVAELERLGTLEPLEFQPPAISQAVGFGGGAATGRVDQLLEATAEQIREFPIDAALEVGSSIGESVAQALRSLGDPAITFGLENLGQVFRGMAETIIASTVRLVAQLLALRAVLSLFPGLNLLGAVAGAVGGGNPLTGATLTLPRLLSAGSPSFGLSAAPAFSAASLGFPGGGGAGAGRPAAPVTIQLGMYAGPFGELLSMAQQIQEGQNFLDTGIGG